ncbi:unnamed protein product [Heligmosomoides polygyrus]|uniref:Helicase ATP-binding domain-containing protein n=1 Tax=Heligmosomoides polygyrus TaxID=6339 RepID=A0A183GV20_HELPZ|nr:unnamed protein product [Heligmosomoides polygyrus]
MVQIRTVEKLAHMKAQIEQSSFVVSIDGLKLTPVIMRKCNNNKLICAKILAVRGRELKSPPVCSCKAALLPNASVRHISWRVIGVDESLKKRSAKTNRDSLVQTPIILREYQKELCEKALEGMNTIIAAPTGSGKTVVAVNIIKRHLEKALSGGKARKVLFMTPSTIILDQQAQCLRKFLGHRYEVLSVCGSDNVPLREIISAKDVVVTTPQCIVNLLNEDSISDRIEDSIRSTFDITTFTLIVFDECHNTVKNYCDRFQLLSQIVHRVIGVEDPKSNHMRLSFYSAIVSDNSNYLLRGLSSSKQVSRSTVGSAFLSDFLLICRCGSRGGASHL